MSILIVIATYSLILHITYRVATWNVVIVTVIGWFPNIFFVYTISNCPSMLYLRVIAMWNFRIFYLPAGFRIFSSMECIVSWNVSINRSRMNLWNNMIATLVAFRSLHRWRAMRILWLLHRLVLICWLQEFLARVIA